MKMKILIAGDSFAAKWPGYSGWAKLLEKEYTVTNVAQAGVSEYKILQQLKGADLQQYDKVVVSHTNPYRLHTVNHPIHNQGLHKNCDLIYNDIADRFSFFNPSLKAAQKWFEYHFDKEYQEEIYTLIRKEIKKIIPSKKYISITHTDISNEYAVETDNINFSEIWQQYKGIENHYNTQGNKIVYATLLDIIKK